MSRYDETSILRDIDLDNVESLRRLMNGLMRRLAGATEWDAVQTSSLQANEREALHNIYELTRDNDLLRDMVTRFASARYGNARTILRATTDLDRMATEAVQIPDMRPTREYEMARGYFDRLLQDGEFVYRLGGDSEYGNVEQDSSDDNGARKYLGGIKPAAKGGSKSLGSAKPVQSLPPNKSKGMGVSVGSAMGFTTSSESDADDEGSDSGLDEAAKASKAAKAKKEHDKRHAPMKTRGDRVLDDGTQDRKSAKVGVKDKSKLVITYHTERDDPDRPGKVMAGDTFAPKFPNKVKWDDKKSIAALNSWRYQSLRRNIGPTRETRNSWTVFEHDMLLHLLRSHLVTKQVGGDYSSTDWGKIAERINGHFRNHTFNIGEMTAAIRFHTKDGKKDKDGKDKTFVVVSTSKPLTKAHTFIERSAGAVKNQLNHFTSAEAVKLLADAKAVRRQQRADGEVSSDSSSSSEDDDNDDETPSQAADGKRKRGNKDDTPSKPRGKKAATGKGKGEGATNPPVIDNEEDGNDSGTTVSEKWEDL